MAETDPTDLDNDSLQAEARARIQPLVGGLMEQRRYRLPTTLLLDSICRQLIDCGIPVHRASLQVRQLHPQFASRTIMWESEAGGAVELGRRHGSHLHTGYLTSPIRLIFEGGGSLRRRIGDPDCPIDFPVLDDLRRQGYVDYVIEPVTFAGGVANALSFATRRRSGFTDLELAMIREALPVVGAVLELEHLRRTAQGLLRTYLGPSAGDRVLSGTVQRGDGEVIHAVIWFCDLRGFTALSESLPMDALLGLMNDYFDEICGEIADNGGEVLKLIGDAILAIFPIAGAEGAMKPAKAEGAKEPTGAEGAKEPAGAEGAMKPAGAEGAKEPAKAEGAKEPAETGGATAAACAAAVKTALGAFERLERRNRERKAAGLAPIRCGVALHVGDVLYGNVGSVDRLDFTVTGPAVNVAARLEALSAGLDLPLVLSADFARICGRDCRSLGSHALKGVASPQEAFTLA